MNLKNRLYSCKNEELVPLSKFTLYSFKRDMVDFSAFSTQFSEQYVTETEAMITNVETLLEPQAETLTLKLIYQTMVQNLADIQKLLLHIEGYVKLAKKETGITPAALGISLLRRSIYRGDFEGVLKGLKVLMSNLQNHLPALETKGMPTTMLQTLQEHHNGLAASKQKQFEIKTNRAAIVQTNIQTVNNLYTRLVEIYTIGKLLYKNSDPAKYADYTFTKLVKKVRNTTPKTTPPAIPIN